MELFDILEEGLNVSDDVEGIITPGHCFCNPFRWYSFPDVLLHADQFVSISEVSQLFIRHLHDGLKNRLLLSVGDFILDDADRSL